VLIDDETLIKDEQIETDVRRKDGSTQILNLAKPLSAGASGPASYFSPFGADPSCSSQMGEDQASLPSD
jgi:hypothetical protein